MMNPQHKSGELNMKNLPLIIINHLKSQHKPTNKLNWNYYLTGLIQVCGKVSLIASFDKLGYTIDISLEINDITLTHTLREIIGFGKIQRYDHIALITYSIVEPRGLIKIYELTKNKFSLTNLNYSNNHNPFNTINHIVTKRARGLPYYIKYWYPIDFNSRGMAGGMLSSPGCNEFSHFYKPCWYAYQHTDIQPLLNYETISHYWVSGVLGANLRKGQMQLNLKALYPITKPLTYYSENLSNIGDLGLVMSEKENKRLNRTKHGSGKYLMSQILFEIDLINTSYLTLTKVNQIFGLSLVNLNYFIKINIKIHPIDTHIPSYINNTMTSINSYQSLDNYGENKYLNVALKYGVPKGFTNKMLNYYKVNARKEMSRIFASHLKFSFPSVNLIKLLNHLDNYPLLSYKFPKFLKFRKIYRICQRKEHLHKSGLLKLLNLWECVRAA